MTDWKADKYLQFQKQRTQPAIDLAERIKNNTPKNIIDIGCGPGNSTEVLKRYFPDSSIIGIDTSENMINTAREKYPDLKFEVRSALDIDDEAELLFSNACLQWIPKHEQLLPDLMKKLKTGGCLAVQMPMNGDEPLFRIIKEVSASGKWNFENVCSEQNDVLSPEKYFDILSECSIKFDMWETVYYHAFPSHEYLIEWVRGSRLRPYLAVLSENDKVQFEQELLNRARKEYKVTKSGEVVFKFRRIFFTAYK